MKEQEKQIEETAKVLHDLILETEASCEKILEELLKHYQLVDKNSVVLSKEEYGSKLQDAYDNGVEFGTEWGGKETAEKFYKKVRKLLKKVDIIVDGDEGLVGYEESAVDKGLTKLAKQFGVEIKE